MIARGLLCFHPARLHAPSRPLSKSLISPTYEHFSGNSFVSPTCAKTGGVYPPKNVGAPTFSPSSPNPGSPPRYSRARRSFSGGGFSIVCALFHFPYHTHPLSFQHVLHSLPKNPGYTSRSYQFLLGPELQNISFITSVDRQTSARLEAGVCSNDISVCVVR